MLSANKGEWSELYALLKLLADGKLNPADNGLNIIDDTFYPVIQITTNADSVENKITYVIVSDAEITVSKPGDPQVVTINRDAIRNHVELFFSQVSKAHDTRGAFPIVGADELLELMERKSISAASYQRADLVLEIYDSKLNRKNELGYSVKSQVGSASTLFNASRQTNATYEITGIETGNLKEIDSLGSSRKKLEKIYQLGGKISYVKFDSQVFSNNLSLIDSNFDKILAESIIIYNVTDARKVSDIINHLPEADLKLGNFDHTLDFYKNNFRKFLFYTALGMVAGSEWRGMSLFEGGIIVVKKNGILAGYNPSSINNFHEYLLANTKFDTPDTRLKFGSIYQESEKNYIKLNFQIRFTR